MGLLKSCLAVMNIKRNYKMKEKILHLSPMLNLKLGKMNLLTVSNKRDSNFSMLIYENRNLVKKKKLFWKIKHYACFRGNGNRM